MLSRAIGRKRRTPFAPSRKPPRSPPQPGEPTQSDARRQGDVNGSMENQMMQSPRDIALDMGRAEKEGDKDSFERYLHNDLIFRRANGSIANKETFLTELKP